MMTEEKDPRVTACWGCRGWVLSVYLILSY